MFSVPALFPPWRVHEEMFSHPCWRHGTLQAGAGSTSDLSHDFAEFDPNFYINVEILINQWGTPRPVPCAFVSAWRVEY